MVWQKVCIFITQCNKKKDLYEFLQAKLPESERHPLGTLWLCLHLLVCDHCSCVGGKLQVSCEGHCLGQLTSQYQATDRYVENNLNLDITPPLLSCQHRLSPTFGFICNFSMLFKTIFFCRNIKMAISNYQAHLTYLGFVSFLMVPFNHSFHYILFHVLKASVVQW